MLGLRRSSALALLFLTLGVYAQDLGTDTGADTSGDTGTTDDGSATADDGSMDDGSGASVDPSPSPSGSPPVASSSPAPGIGGTPTANATTPGPAASAGNGTVVNEHNPNWNKTWFVMPNRNKDGYWVNGIANVASWIPVPDPADIVLVNANNSAFGPNKVVASNIPGGANAVNVTINDVPVGPGYTVWLVEAGTMNKLGQSNGFNIRPAGTEQGSTATEPIPVPTYNPNPNGEANGAGGAAANNGATVVANGAGIPLPSILGMGVASLMAMAALV